MCESRSSKPRKSDRPSEVRSPYWRLAVAAAGLDLGVVIIESVRNEAPTSIFVVSALAATIKFIVAAKRL